MDQDAELARFKWILFVGVAFLISAAYSYNELKFAVWGNTAEARVTQTREIRGSGRRSSPKLAVEYQFTEADGTGRSERDDVAIDWPLPTTGSTTVQYLPGVADSSRLLGHSSMFSVYVFLGSLVFLAIAGYRLSLQANGTISASGRRLRK